MADFYLVQLAQCVRKVHSTDNAIVREMFTELGKRYMLSWLVLRKPIVEHRSK